MQELSESVLDTLTELIESNSTWKDNGGRLWVIDHFKSSDYVIMRPDWIWRGYQPAPQRLVSRQDLLLTWSRIESPGQRIDRLQEQRQVRCKLGYHDDPDNSGLCISCGKVLDGELNAN